MIVIITIINNNIDGNDKDNNNNIKVLTIVTSPCSVHFKHNIGTNPKTNFETIERQIDE